MLMTISYFIIHQMKSVCNTRLLVPQRAIDLFSLSLSLSVLIIIIFHINCNPALGMNASMDVQIDKSEYEQRS